VKEAMRQNILKHRDRFFVLDWREGYGESFLDKQPLFRNTLFLRKQVFYPFITSQKIGGFLK
jgi:hypothetical protein